VPDLYKGWLDRDQSADLLHHRVVAIARQGSQFASVGRTIWSQRCAMSKTRVAVIDDDASVLRSLERLLHVAGHETSGFPSVESFLASGEGPITNGLILDLLLPGMCGLEAISLLKRDFPAMKIIVISGCGRAKNLEVLEAARRLGADAYFSKPLDVAELLATVRQLLQRQEEALRSREALK